MTIQSKNSVMVSKFRKCYTIKRYKMAKVRQIIIIMQMRQVAKQSNGVLSWTTWSQILMKCSIKVIPIRRSPL